MLAIVRYMADTGFEGLGRALPLAAIICRLCGKGFLEQEGPLSVKLSASHGVGPPCKFVRNRDSGAHFRIPETAIASMSKSACARPVLFVFSAQI